MMKRMVNKSKIRIIYYILSSNTHLRPPCDISGPSSLESNIKIGDKVRVKPSVVTPTHKWGAVTHKSIGVVKSKSIE